MKTALVLSGGGAAGAFEAGVMEVLLQHITPDFIIGTSSGAVNAAFYASGNSTKDIMQFWANSTRSLLMPFNYEVLYKFHKARSLFTNHGLYNFLQKEVKVDKFEQCHIPLHVSATELVTGKDVYFSQGLLLPALMASCAIPPYLPPYSIGKKTYVDGGVSNYIGTEKAIELGARQIIVVNAHFHPQKPIIHNLIDLAGHTFKLLKYQALKKEIAMCKSVHVVEVHSKKSAHIPFLGFNAADILIQEGKRLARKAVKELHYT